VQCDSCGRKFNDKSITKHRKVCKKVFVEKRPEFNVEAMRKCEDLLQLEQENK